MRLIGDGIWWLKHAVLAVIDNVVARYYDWCEHAPDRGR